MGLFVKFGNPRRSSIFARLCPLPHHVLARKPPPNGAPHGRGLRALRTARRRRAVRQVHHPLLPARADTSLFVTLSIPSADLVSTRHDNCTAGERLGMDMALQAGIDSVAPSVCGTRGTDMRVFAGRSKQAPASGKRLFANPRCSNAAANHERRKNRTLVDRLLPCDGCHTASCLFLLRLRVPTHYCHAPCRRLLSLDCCVLVSVRVLLHTHASCGVRGDGVHVDGVRGDGVRDGVRGDGEGGESAHERSAQACSQFFRCATLWTLQMISLL